jgi:hypothetical protein
MPVVNTQLKTVINPTAFVVESLNHEISDQFRVFHNEQHSGIHRPSGIVRIVKYVSIQSAGHVARLGETRNAYRMLVWKTLENVHW